MVKQSSSFANEESVEILSGSTVLYSKTNFVASQLETFETCLQSTTNNQYQIKMDDSYGDSWSSGSWVGIKGKYGNYFFRGYITASYTETYPLSLYYPITDDCAWKLFSGSDQSGWNTLGFNDAGWTEVFLNSVTTPVQGTQYFRKTYTGITGMAAYELAMQYTTGIVAYINGVEIYRDNMPAGPVTSQTQASGIYPALVYHHIIRPGNEASATSSVLAIEVHGYNAPLTSVNFNAWMALLAPSTLDSKPCVVYSGDVTINSVSGTNPANAFDLNKGDYFYLAAGSTEPVTLSYSLTGPKAFVNGIRLWPYGSASYSPNTVTFQGSENFVGGPWTTIMEMSQVVHTNNQYSYQLGVFNSKLYNSYQAIIQPLTTYMYLYELQPLICDVALPTSIVYEQTSYTGYSGYSTLKAIPLVTDWTGCQVSPALASGLTLSTNCVITGTVTTALPTTTYTVTATANGQTYTGTVSIGFTDCAGTLVKLTRSYKTDAADEFFTITDTATQTVVYQVAANSGQINNQDWEHLICLTGSRYKVTLGATTSFWQRQSFMYVRASLSNGETEILSRIKYNQYLNIPEEHYFYPLYATAPLQNWYYKNAEVPANWHSSDLSGWTQGQANQYPVSTNTIQLYKTTFNVNNIANIGPMSIHVRYLYGVVIYLNGREIFRNHLEAGDITASTMAIGSYTGDPIYRQITLPTHIPATATEPAIDFVQQGTNTLAIALVAITASQTAGHFDASLRFIGTEASSRLLAATLNWSNISGSPSYVLYWDHLSPIYYDACPTTVPKNYYQITFSNDRRDWVSSIEIQLAYQQFDKFVRSFKLLARNTASEPWTELLNVQGLTWSLVGQNRRIWIPNYKAYNMYRFEDFSTGSMTDCAWKLGRFDLFSQDTTAEPPALTYQSTISIFKNIEMAEVYPSSDLYTQFTVSPALPAGITLDPYNGMISGTASAESPATTYTVTAEKYNGGSVTATFTLDVGICHGGRSLITLVTLTDSQYQTSSYKLYQGKQATGTPIQQIDKFKAGNILNYADFCIPHDLYTAQLVAPTADGWANPAGYYLSVDIGSLRFDIGQVKTQTHNVLFSSFLPFQQEFDNWKVYSDVAPVPAGWNAVAFDDSTWRDIKAVDIGTSEATTVYIRRSFNIPDINDYQVLNAHVKYMGGVAAYFNGNLVARFNLEEYFTAKSESIGTHNPNTLSKFHVILPLAGGVTGVNVMSFEIHRPAGSSSAEPVVFDATGVFGVNQCSVLVDTYADIESSQTSNVEDATAFFDITPASFGYIPNAVGSYISWSVENLMGSKFNSFALQTTQSVTNFGFSLYGRTEADAEQLSMFAMPGLTTVERERSAYEVPVGIASFRLFRYEVDQPASTNVIFSTILTQYCKATGTVCQAMEEYPPVGDGQISPAPCPEGFRGYAYRVCTGTTFGEVHLDKCSYKLPDKLTYTSTRLSFVKDTHVTSARPSYVNIIEEFYMAEGTQLPTGLTLNSRTGQIEGVPTEITGVRLYTIYGKNPTGATMTTVPIEVRVGECLPEDVFPLMEVGKTYTYDCAMKGSYIGTITRECKLGAEDGEWQKKSGMCVPTALIWVLVIVVVVVIIVVMKIISNKKAAAAAAAKKKKASSKKAPSKKGTTKTVKI